MLVVLNTCLNAQSKLDTTLPKKWVRECRENVSILLKAIDLKDSLLNVRFRTIQSFQASNDVMKGRLSVELRRSDSLQASLKAEQSERQQVALRLSRTRKNRKWYAIAGFGAGVLMPLLIKPP